jgi:two-component system phosphate regulon sensor histidine kinase PhoR
MARLDKEDIELKKENINLHEVIQEVVTGMNITLQEKNGNAQLKLDAENPIITADRHHLTNVIYNLLDNAIKYCKERPLIVIRTIQDKKGIRLEVQDNGIGVNEEHQKKIFHKFFRVPTGNVHDVKGFGLGLNYVKQIVEAHRGKISMESIVGNGSTFKVFMPY